MDSNDVEITLLQPVAKDAPVVSEPEKETEPRTAEEQLSKTGLKLKLQRPG